MTPNPDLISWTSLFTLQGATAAVVVVVNVLGSVVGTRFDALRKPLALVLSLACGLLGLTQIDDIATEHWVVAVLNGFLIAAAALGVNETTVGGRGRLKGADGGFRQSWL